MFKEYFVVATYIARVPQSRIEEEFIIEQMASEIRSYPMDKLEDCLKNLFHVIVGEEVEDIEEDDE